MAKLKGIPFDANEIILPDGTLGYDNIIYSADFAEWLATYFKNGVLVPGGELISTELKVETTDSTHIKINTGNLVMNGRTAFVPEAVFMEITPAQPDLSRKDRVIVEMDLRPDYNLFELKIVSGTLSSSPEAPELVKTDEIYQMSLATLTIDVNGVSAIQDDRIDDDLCGISQVLIGVKPPKPVTGDSADNISYDGSTSGITGTTVQAAIDEVAAKDYEKTLLMSGWTSSGENVVQTLTIAGFTSTMKAPLVDIVASSALDSEEWGKIWKAETSANSITFYARATPKRNLNIKVRTVG